jgi:hypothetical protein
MRLFSTFVNRANNSTAVQSALSDDSYLFSALLEQATDSIYFKDTESRFVKV